MSHAHNSHHSEGHDHQDNQPHGFLNTVFDNTMGGFGILWVSILVLTILFVLLFG